MKLGGLGWSVERFDRTLMHDTFAVLRHVSLLTTGAGERKTEAERKREIFSDAWMQKYGGMSGSTH